MASNYPKLVTKNLSSSSWVRVQAPPHLITSTLLLFAGFARQSATPVGFAKRHNI
jgi:hypothetical protein